MNIIKNTTNISKKQYIRFYWFSLRRGRGLFTTVFLFLLVAGVLLLVNNALQEYSTAYDSSTFFITLAFIFLVLAFSLFYFTPARAYKKIKEIANEYVFNDETIEIETHKPEVSAHASYRYSGIAKAYERKDIFYIFIDKRRAFLVSKSGFTQGSADELRALLINQLGNKFHYPRSKV